MRSVNCIIFGFPRKINQKKIQDLCVTFTPHGHNLYFRDHKISLASEKFFDVGSEFTKCLLVCSRSFGSFVMSLYLFLLVAGQEEINSVYL